jgi:ribokinase
MGPKNAIVKLGERGAYLALEDGTRTAVPAFQVKAVDTTAAGDCFNGAFAVSLAKGAHPLEAARFAAAASAISVTRHGAQPSMPTLAEVEAFLKAHQRPAK